MLDFNQLSPLMRELHLECVKLYYLMLPVFFALAVAFQWFKRGQGAIDYLDLLKRTIVSTLLLIAFPEIADVIINVTEGIATRIDSLKSLDKLFLIAEEKINGYTDSPMSILLQFGDMALAICTFLSFLFVFIVQFVSLAMFHFFWLFLVVTAPLLLLFNIFESTSQIVGNLFRSLIEVACWKIVWAIFGVILASLSFGEMYRVEGSYVTVIVMNVVVAFSILSTPIMVRGLMGAGIQSTAPMLTFSAVAVAIKLPSVAMKMQSLAKGGPSMGMRSNLGPKLGDNYEYKSPPRGGKVT